MNTRTAQVRIGTSGWTYDHWKGTFYPDDLADADRLAYYAGQFGSVEINNSFYRLPDAQTLAHWRDSVPADFRFAVKASRYITHMKKLKDLGESLAGLLDRVAVLGAKCGPMLFQLPPNWRFNAQRLAAFLDALPGGRRYAFEFRDHSWLNDETYALLARHGAALCIYDLDGYHSPRALTTDFAYIRLHGPAVPGQLRHADPVRLERRHLSVDAPGPRRLRLLRQRPSRSRRCRCRTVARHDLRPLRHATCTAKPGAPRPARPFAQRPTLRVRRETDHTCSQDDFGRPR